ncbi:HepT-like ribonuclease domain-containing protein [Subtercola frigoramans]|uniref:HepT-like ribonuclease domain-containing protein n=1 Tax=Subtercola frigoramans TaxID=120298 RepID=UPI003CD05BAC
MRPESAALLWDVRNAAARIAEFIAGLDSDAYAQDELRRSAIDRQLGIIGEALRSLRSADPETAQLTPKVYRIIGLRNVLAHGYTTIDDSIVWGAASQRVPDLIAMVEELVKPGLNGSAV